MSASPGRDEAEARGSCYGYRVLSESSFEYLREGGGEDLRLPEMDAFDPPERGELIHVWHGARGGNAAMELYAGPDGYFLKMGEVHSFSVRRGGRTILMGPPPCGAHREELLWATPAAVAMTARGDLVLHGASVAAGDRAVLLVGPSHAGKTSTAAAFHCAGHRLLSDDTTCVRLSDGEVLVPPGPALIRLRWDAADRLDPPDVYATLESSEKVHLAVSPSRRGTGRPLELAGIVVLVVTDGQPELSRLPPDEAVKALWPVSFYIPDGNDFQRSFRGLTKLAQRVPVWRLARGLDWDALPGVVDRIVDRVVRP